MIGTSRMALVTLHSSGLNCDLSPFLCFSYGFVTSKRINRSVAAGTGTLSRTTS